MARSRIHRRRRTTRRVRRMKTRRHRKTMLVRSAAGPLRPGVTIRRTYAKTIDFIVTANNTASDVQVIAPQLVQMPGSSDFTNLFQMYRLKKMSLVVLPIANEGSSTLTNVPLKCVAFAEVRHNTLTISADSLQQMSRYNVQGSNYTVTGAPLAHFKIINPVAFDPTDTSKAGITDFLSTNDSGWEWRGVGMNIFIDPSTAQKTVHTIMNITCDWEFRGVQ